MNNPQTQMATESSRRQLLVQMAWGSVIVMIAVGIPIYVEFVRPIWSNWNLNSLMQLNLAIANYEAKHGHFPAVVSDDGTPLHSWRVMVLPFIEEQALFDQYDFEEPWDGPNNRKLIEQMPDTFRHTSDEGPVTRFQAVVGDSMSWPMEGTSRERLNIPPMQSMVTIVETRDPVIWTKPDGVRFEDLLASVGPSFHAAFTDGHAATLKKSIDPTLLHRLFTGRYPEHVNQQASPLAEPKP